MEVLIASVLIEGDAVIFKSLVLEFASPRKEVGLFVRSGPYPGATIVLPRR